MKAQRQRQEEGIDGARQVLLWLLDKSERKPALLQSKVQVATGKYTYNYVYVYIYLYTAYI